MQYKDGSVGSGTVDLLQSGHTPLGKLELRPATDHPNPLRRRCALRLLAEHAQRVSERRHAVPAQFHVVVETAADRMHVRIVETGNHGPAADVDNFGRLASKTHDFAV